MNTYSRNALITIVIVVVAGAVGGAYLQYRSSEDEIAAVNNGQVAGETDDGSSVPDGTPVSAEVKLNETARAAGVVVNPVEVVEESRCPVDVQCIQAGTVRVRAFVTERGATEAMDVMFELNVPMTVGSDQITLVKVAPEPREGATIASGDYVFTFTVVKGGGSEYYKG